MAKPRLSPPLTRGYDPVDAGFLDARGKLLDVAAFLDRVERYQRASDHRVRALRTALKKLSKPDRPAQRAASVLRALGDPTTKLAAKAGAPAAGAWKRPAAKR